MKQNYGISKRFYAPVILLKTRFVKADIIFCIEKLQIAEYKFLAHSFLDMCFSLQSPLELF